MASIALVGPIYLKPPSFQDMTKRIWCHENGFHELPWVGKRVLWFAFRLYLDLPATCLSTLADFVDEVRQKTFAQLEDPGIASDEAGPL